MIKTSRGLLRHARLTLCAMAVAAGLFASAGESAQGAIITQTTLDTLLIGGSNQNGLTIGDKKYSGFSLASTGDAPPDAEDISVTLSTNDNVTYSIKFNFGLDAFAGERTDVTIGYRLDVVNSSDLIARLGLTFNGSVPAPGTGNAAASISELVRTIDGSDIDPTPATSDTAVLTVFNDGPGRLADNNSQFLQIIPKASLLFEKNILVSSRADGGYVHVSVVDNLVEQTGGPGVVVPEPTSLLGLTALSGIALLRRRSQA